MRGAQSEPISWHIAAEPSLLTQDEWPQVQTTAWQLLQQVVELVKSAKAQLFSQLEAARMGGPCCSFRH